MTEQRGVGLPEQHEIDGDDPLVAVLYVLMRDHLPIGTLVGVVRENAQVGSPVGGEALRAVYSNELLARMATKLAVQLRPEPRYESKDCDESWVNR